MNERFKFDVYKHEKIEVFSDYIEKYKSDNPEDLAEDILHHLNIVFYQIENVKLNPYKNPNPHMVIEYTIEL
ncbi:MAG: hypothetical protein K0U38_01250 [Epsilonproteobacteria bacterium]|nr:hypothetical protein [Campylobacterota bacterium]